MNYMESKKAKTLLGLIFWFFLAVLMLRNPIEKLQTGVSELIMHLIIGLIFSYYIVAYFFGWSMPLNVGALRKEENKILRLVMLIVFIGFWLWGFWGF